MVKSEKNKNPKQRAKTYKVRNKKKSIKRLRDEFMLIKFYMLDNQVFKGLSGNACKLYLYLIQRAHKSEEWENAKIFEYSQSVAQRENIMSQAEAKRSLDELWKNGFIEKVGRGFRGTNTWKFSNRWRNGSVGFIAKEEPFVENDKGYVYLIKVGDAYKIGISQRPQERLKEFTLLAYEMEIILCVELKDYKLMEKTLHKKYAKENIRGEWFHLNKEDIQEIREFLDKEKQKQNG